MKIKKLLSVFLAVSMLTPAALAEYQADEVWQELYVSVFGNDEWDGSKNKPFATIEHAKEYVKTISDDMKGDIIVNISEGTYYLDEALSFASDDSGKNGHRIIYRGENMPQISGGVKVGTFTPTEINGVYKASVDGVSFMRELYVNGKKAYVASSNRQVKGIKDYDDPSTIFVSDGMYMSRSDIGEWENPEDIEFNWQINWKNNTCMVSDIIPDPENAEQVIVLMENDWWEKKTTSSDDSLVARPSRPFLMKNAFELLDKPGEFYYNKKEKTVYYIPREGEDLSTAEVIAPRLDRLMIFDGNDKDDRVKNISFEGLKIAHAAFYGADGYGLETAQQQNTRRTNDIPWVIPATINMMRAENIEFTNNYFFGFGSSGIHMMDGVDGTVIDGNAFSDIGDAGIVVGRWEQGGVGTTYDSVQKNPPENAGEFNLINGYSKLAASYNGNFDVLAGSKNWVDDTDYEFSSKWTSNPYAIKKGEKSWVRYDFDVPYNITRIQLGFADDIPDEERMNYEILLSNDRDFENYVTVAVQENPADKVEEYIPEADGEKYRYLMIRTTETATMSLSRVWVFTGDRKPYSVNVPTRNNTISNNYITRTGESICSGGGISAFYTSGLKITDNEICDIPYSGIMFGWGWSNKAEGSGDNYVARNFVHNTNKTMHDGAAIYMLSCQRGTVVEENYVRDVYIGAGGYYPDEGSSYSIWRNNVSEDTFRIYNIWISTIRENQFLSNYGWHGINRNDGTDNAFEPINIYLPGHDSAEAYNIKKNAGLKPEYMHLKEMVPVAELEVEEPRVIIEAQGSDLMKHFNNYVTYVAKNMLEYGSFGNMPGDYPMEYKYKLEEGLSEIGNTESKTYRESLLKIRKAINDAADNVIRVPFDELTDMCETSVSNSLVDAKKSAEGSVTLAEKKAFEKAVSDIKAEYDTAKNEGHKFEALKKLEKEYRGFEDKKAGMELRYVKIENMIDERIDLENKTVEVLMPANADRKNLSIDVICAPTAKSALFEKQINFTDEFEIPVYSETIGKYAYWKVIPVSDFGNTGWLTIAEETNTVVKNADDNVYLSINKAPYMKGRYFAPLQMQTIRFVPKNASDETSMSFIFGADTAVSFEKNSPYKKDNHFRLETKGDKASIYERENGAERLLKSDIDFKVLNNRENEIRVRLLPFSDKTVIAIWLNGEMVAHTIANRQALSGYIGFHNEKTGIEVIE